MRRRGAGHAVADTGRVDSAADRRVLPLLAGREGGACRSAAPCAAEAAGAPSAAATAPRSAHRTRGSKPADRPERCAPSDPAWPTRQGRLHTRDTHRSTRHSQMTIRPAQNGCAARDSNSEPRIRVGQQRAVWSHPCCLVDGVRATHGAPADRHGWITGTPCGRATRDPGVQLRGLETEIAVGGSRRGATPVTGVLPGFPAQGCGWHAQRLVQVVLGCLPSITRSPPHAEPNDPATR
jgi:hypothetical protein